MSAIHIGNTSENTEEALKALKDILVLPIADKIKLAVVNKIGANLFAIPPVNIAHCSFFNDTLDDKNPTA